MENREEDSIWRKAMEGAEETPSDGVWSAIESDLIAAENVKMKRSVVMYQRLAAACVLFALSAGAYSFYYRGSRIPATASQETTSSPTVAQGARQPALAGKNPSAKLSGNGIKRDEQIDAEGNAALSTERSLPESLTPISAAAPNQITGSHLSPASALSAPLQDNELPVASGVPVTAEAEEKSSVSEDALGAANSLATIQLPPVIASGGPDSSVQKQALADNSPIRIKKEDGTQPAWNTVEKVNEDAASDETMWASVGASAGIYNAGTKAAPAQAGFSAVSGSKAASGQAISFGAAVARKLAPRWVVQGGLSYINQSTGSSSYTSDPTTNSLGGPPVSFQTGNYAQAVLAKAASPARSLTCTQEFIAVPVQAGYLLVDHKIKLLLNAGVSSNFFVRNSLKDESGNTVATAPGAGGETTYRPLSWSGLMSTELTYKVARQYRFSLVPGMRYGLTAATKAGGDRPYVMDIGFRVRYNF